MAAAYDGYYDFCVAHYYSSDGQPDDGSQGDNAFGTDGVVSTAMYYTRNSNNIHEYSIPYGVAVQADGSIVAVGTLVDYADRTDDFMLQRYTATGALDTGGGTGFGGGTGIVTTEVPGDTAEASAVAIQPDGRIVVGGSTSAPANGYYGYALARYTPGNIGQTVNVTDPSVCTWDGGDAPNTDLSDPDNYTNYTAPIGGDDLYFPVSNTTAVNDFPDGTVFGSIEIAAGGFARSRGAASQSKPASRSIPA